MNKVCFFSLKFCSDARLIFVLYPRPFPKRVTVGRNNAKPLWRECGKWSMVRLVAVKLRKTKANKLTMNMTNIYGMLLTVVRKKANKT